jgi:GNAT superfamily N-acetyltransferase
MIRIRTMSEADIPLGMRLKAQAGWNQTEADWRRALRLGGDGCFVAELDGAAVGTTTTCVFGPVAWVALVLVNEAARGRGVGTALVRHALTYLDGRGVRSVRLDATPLGRPVYEKLGFVAEYALARYAGVLPAVGEAKSAEPLQEWDLPQLLRLDKKVSGADRAGLLTGLYEEHRSAFRVVLSGSVVFGALTSRAGQHATQIGPCLAPYKSVGEWLLADARERFAGQRVFLDVPLVNEPAVACVERLGLRPQRQLLRMSRGEPVPERVDSLWASFGPEKG